MVSRLGGLLTLTSSGCSVDFGPAQFLPLHPLITYRYASDSLYLRVSYPSSHLCSPCPLINSPPLLINKIKLLPLSVLLTIEVQTLFFFLQIFKLFVIFPPNVLSLCRAPISAGTGEASLSSSSLSVRDVLRQRYSVTWHPRLFYLIVSDGYMATVMKVLDKPSPALLMKALLKDTTKDLEKTSQRLNQSQVTNCDCSASDFCSVSMTCSDNAVSSCIFRWM